VDQMRGIVLLVQGIFRVLAHSQLILSRSKLVAMLPSSSQCPHLVDITSAIGVVFIFIFIFIFGHFFTKLFQLSLVS
jgi:preprotein translocase subunit SecY